MASNLYHFLFDLSKDTALQRRIAKSKKAAREAMEDYNLSKREQEVLLANDAAKRARLLESEFSKQLGMKPCC